MNTQVLEEEMKNDLTGEESQEREFYDTQYFYDGYLLALLTQKHISQKKYSRLHAKMHSYKWSGETNE